MPSLNIIGYGGHGRVVAEGVGARSLNQDYGDINKSLKMVEKSAHIDATLRLAGLSEVFTQDIEDRAIVDDDEPNAESAPSSSKRNVASRKSQGKAATAATPATNADGEEIVSREEVAGLRQRISQYGFTEKRVLAWLYKTTEGCVTKLEQLTIGQCVSILKRLELWAEGEKSFAKGKERK